MTSEDQDAGAELQTNKPPEQRQNLLEELVLCFSIKLIDADLENLQASVSLWETQTCQCSSGATTNTS